MIAKILTTLVIGLCGMQNLHNDINAEAYKLLHRYYEGQNAQDVLQQGEFKYVMTFEEIYEWAEQASVGEGLDVFYKTDGTIEPNDVAMMLYPLNNNNYNQVILISPYFIELESYRSYGKCTFDFYYGNDQVRRIRSEDYYFRGFVYNTDIETYASDVLFELWYDGDPLEMAYTYSRTEAPYQYKVETITINGMLAPFIQVFGSYQDVANYDVQLIERNGIPQVVERILTAPFINNGQYYTNSNVTAICQGHARNGNPSDIDYYVYSYCYQDLLNYGTNIYRRNNQIQFKDKEESEDDEFYWVRNRTNPAWLYNGANTFTLLWSDYISEINGINQTQKDCLTAHMTMGSSYSITGNTDVTDIFTLLGNAFSGIGGFFNIAIIPGITLGALITIPVLTTIIIWLIHLFKRGN